MIPAGAEVNANCATDRHQLCTGRVPSLLGRRTPCSCPCHAATIETTTERNPE